MRSTSLLLVVSLTGCYFTFGTPPRDATPERPCTRARTLPVVDAAVGVTGALLAVGGALALVDDNDESSATLVVGAVSLLAAVPMAIGGGLSARAGFRDTGRCRAP